MAVNAHEPVLNNEIASLGGKWLRFNVLFSEISAAATTAVEDLLTLRAGDAIVQVSHFINTNFDGGATSELTLQIGVTGGDVNQHYTAVSIHEDGTEVIRSVESTATAGKQSTTVGTLISALFTSTGADTDALTAGSVDIWIRVVPFDSIAITTKAL